VNTNIYFIQATAGGPVKIGRTSNVERRLKQHQVSNVGNLRIAGFLTDVPVTYEQELHKQFEPHRIRGEWFSDKVLEVAQQVLEKPIHVIPETKTSFHRQRMLSDTTSSFDLFKISLAKTSVGMSPNTVRKCIKNGLRSYRHGKLLFVSKSELENHIKTTAQMR
jgi:Meiotically up-regulated gene 113